MDICACRVRITFIVTFLAFIDILTLYMPVACVSRGTEALKSSNQVKTVCVLDAIVEVPLAFVDVSAASSRGGAISFISRGTST